MVFNFVLEINWFFFNGVKIMFYFIKEVWVKIMGFYYKCINMIWVVKLMKRVK